MDQWVGIAIFVGFIVLVLVLSLLLGAKFRKKRANRKPQLLDGMRRPSWGPSRRPKDILS